MRFAAVPETLQQPDHQYPPHHTGPGIERYCHEYLSGAVAESWRDLTYLPIYWTNNYYWERQRKRTPEYRPVEAVQKFLDSLPEDDHYVTVVQHCEGIYERLPPHVTVFSAGGRGNCALPLLCSPHSRSPRSRDLLASFCGNIECGGPTSDNPRTSSWNPNGLGARVRRKMREVFELRQRCVVEHRTGTLGKNTARFRELMERSQFALCPRGYGRTSFRLYEALQMGCVPVYLYWNGWRPYTDVLDWDSFAVVADFHDGLRYLPALLRCLEGRRWPDQARKLIAKLVPDYFTFEGMGRQLRRMMGGL